VKYRRVAVGAALVVIVVAVVLWHRQRPSASPAAQATRAAGHSAAGRVPLARDRPGRRVAGVVLLDSAAAPGVAVRIDDTAPVLTDASGRFDLGVQRIARHVVVSEPPRLAGAFAAIDLADPTVDAEHVTLMLHACTASLHGIVRDAAGGEIAHARVAASADGIVPGAGSEAGDDGSYEMCVSPGTVDILVTADGYASQETPIAISGRVRRDFQVVPEAPVVGRVVRAQDHEPVPGARVMLFSEDISSGFVYLYATADDNGRFRITGAAPGRFSIVAWADHLASPRPVPVVAELGATPDEVVCEVVPAPTVSGTVLEDGKPVAGAQVALMPTDYRASLWTPKDAVSAADGTFAIASVQPRTYNAWVSSEQIERPIEVKASDVTGVTLAITRKASISGVVTHDGKPVDGADVQTDDDAAKSDATGHFTLRNLPAGAHGIYAASKRLGVFTPGPTITLAAGEQKTDVAIEMDLAGSIAGVVVDQDDKPGPLPDGDLLVRARGAGRSLTIPRGTSAGVAIEYGDDGFRTTSDGVPARVLRVTNRSARAIRLQVERAGWASPRARGSLIMTIPGFVDLFGTDAPAAGLAMEVGRIAVLFTDLVGSVEIYNRVGDAKAFALVQQHWRDVAQIVMDRRGSVIKTLGDGVFAAFVDLDDAIAAALDVMAAAERLSKQHGLTFAIRAGCHEGPCFIVRANDRVDLFGSTVNLAARLSAVSGGQQLALLATLAEPRSGSLVAAGHDVERTSSTIKGLPGEIAVALVTRKTSSELPRLARHRTDPVGIAALRKPG
jgi:class 3 adenylate cyclase